MQKKWKRIFFAIGLLSVLLAAPVSGDDPVTYFKNDSYLFKLEIHEAYYYDADGDGQEDDIHAHFSLSIYCEGDDDNWSDNCKKIKVDVTYYFDLVLPSGLTFNNKAVWKYRTNLTYHHLTLYNQAVEPGWYDLYITMVTENGGAVKGNAWLTFDPPGGSGGLPLVYLS